MKKLSLLLVVLISFVRIGFGQEVPMKPQVIGEAQMVQEISWETNVPKECFCCNEKVYNLPTVPPIKGQEIICKDLKNLFSTYSCTGATINWTVNPAGISFTGQGTSQINIDYSSIPAGTSVVTIIVEIRCGNKTVKNAIKVKVCPSQPVQIIIREGQDAMLHQLATQQTTNFGLAQSNVVSNWTFGGTAGIMYSVIKFTLPPGLTASGVISAKLSLKEFISPGNGNHAGQYGGATKPTDFEVRRVTSPWTEGLVTWSTMPSTTTSNAVSVVGYTGGTAADDIDIDVTQLVKDMLSSPNKEGFMIRWKDNNTNLNYRSRFFGSFQCPNLSKKPVLIIN